MKDPYAPKKTKNTHTKMLAGVLHVHSTFSDGDLHPAEWVAYALDQGWDFLGMCDHDAIEGSLYAEKCVRALNLPLVTVKGTEVSALQNHIVGMGISRNPSAPFEDVPKICRKIRQQGGMALVAHPTWTPNLTALWKSGRFEQIIRKGIADGYEAVNSGGDNDSAEVLVKLKEHRGQGLDPIIICGTDAHRISHVERSVFFVWVNEKSEIGILQAIREKRVAWHWQGGYWGNQTQIVQMIKHRTPQPGRVSLTIIPVNSKISTNRAKPVRFAICLKGRVGPGQISAYTSDSGAVKVASISEPARRFKIDWLLEVDRLLPGMHAVSFVYSPRNGRPVMTVARLHVEPHVRPEFSLEFSTDRVTWVHCHWKWGSRQVRKKALLRGERRAAFSKQERVVKAVSSIHIRNTKWTTDQMIFAQPIPLVNNIRESKWMFPINRPHQQHLQKAKELKREDAKVWLGWNQKNFLVKVDILDEIHFQPGLGPRSYDGDCVQFAFDPMAGNDCTNFEYYKVGLSLTDKGPQVGTSHNLAVGKKGQGMIPEAKLAIERRGRRLVYDLAMPWKCLAPFNPKKGAMFRFSLMSIVTDGSRVIGWIEMFEHHKGRNRRSGMGDEPSEWGLAVLG